MKTGFWGLAVRVSGFLPVVALGAVGCSKFTPVATEIVSKLEPDLQCSDVADQLIKVLQDTLNEGHTLPSSMEMKQAGFPEVLLPAYQALNDDLKHHLAKDDPQHHLEKLVALELTESSTQFADPHLKRIQTTLQRFRLETQALPDCPRKTPEKQPEESPPHMNSWTSYVQETRAPVVAGAMRVMATAYQSCPSFYQPPVERDTIPVKGVYISGRHSNGVGQLRRISSVADVIRTHHYQKEKLQTDSGCFNVKSQPLIYDYGGKPYAKRADHLLDFHQNAGTGTEVLGFDCSGFVVASLATQGLKVDPNKAVDPMHVYGISASMLMEPQVNGLKCLNHVQIRPDVGIEEGDLLASKGHVVIIGRLGPDPFGIAHLHSASQCTTSHISMERFDFDILHSSPSKNGMGLHRAVAKDYLSEPDASSMRQAMIQYAVQSCRAKFGLSPQNPPTQAKLVRHRLTPECLGSPIRLAREECVSSCQITSEAMELSSSFDRL